MSKTTAKADIDFEKELWDAANELRGAVSENNYKNYILPLVFLKHLSERYDIVQDELTGLLKDPKSSYYTNDEEERLMKGMKMANTALRLNITIHRQVIHPLTH